MADPVHTIPYLGSKVVIVTGAASGIGLASTVSYLASGAKVLGVDISAAPKSIPENKDFVFLQINLLEPTAPEAVVKACEDAFGGQIDVLLNNAGIMDNNASADTVDDGIWNRNIAINLTAPVMLMRAVLPAMKAQQSGSIINVASKAGLSGAVAGVAYTAAKHGLVGATKNVAWRFRDDGIRCNAICPGGVLSQIARSTDPSTKDMAAFEKSKRIHEVGRRLPDRGAVPPEDMVGIILYLSSDFSRTMSGAIIPIDMAWSTI